MKTDRRSPRWLVALVATTLATLLLFALGAPAATAGPVPDSDPAVTGSIGLCDKAGKPVTSGLITDRPFVWRAVSSVQAPDGYSGQGRKATLLAYQPRPNTSADQWSGDQLTATSSYTNPTYPMSQATPVDFTLTDFLGEFKPMVNGLLQLRMYFGIPGRGTYNSTYPATDIQVTGNSWHVVQGASVPCTGGDSTSSEYDNTALNPVPTVVATAPSNAPPRSVSASGTKTVGATTKPTAPTAARSGSSTGSSSAVALAGRKSLASKGSALPVAALVVVPIALAMVLAMLWFRRRAR
jgi:hypothetical protein